MIIKPCWSCGTTDADCYSGCQCVKCLDPEGYKQWKLNRPDQYQRWLENNEVDELEQFHLQQEIFEQQAELQELEEQEAMAQAEIEAELQELREIEETEQAEIQAELEAMEQEELENHPPDEIDCEKLDYLPREEPEEDFCPHCLRLY